MRVPKWGKRLAIRLPSAVVEAMVLREGDDIEVVIADERVSDKKETRQGWPLRAPGLSPERKKGEEDSSRRRLP